MKYLLMIYHDERAFANLTEDDRQEIYREFRNLRDDLTRSGVFVTGSQLKPTSTASSVRVREVKTEITDGPFAETKEQLGGYFLIEAKDINEANAVAARIPTARVGTIEVRELV